MKVTIPSLRTVIAAAAFAVVASTATAQSPTCIDFSGAPDGFFPTYSEGGATFSAIDDSNLTTTFFGPAPNGTRGLLSENLAWLRADIAGGTDWVSVDLGDYNSDADLLFLAAYGAGDVLLGETTLLIDVPDYSMHTLSFGSAGIQYAIFGSRAPSIGGSSVYADNFCFIGGPQAEVPEPGTLALLAGAGVVGLSVLRRRRA